MMRLRVADHVTHDRRTWEVRGGHRSLCCVCLDEEGNDSGVAAAVRSSPLSNPATLSTAIDHIAMGAVRTTDARHRSVRRCDVWVSEA